MSDKEAVGKWAIITLHPALPSRTEQVARARAWIMPDDWFGPNDTSSLIEDDVREEPRTTKWEGKFPARAAFLKLMKTGRLPRPQVAFFATPLCVGFGKAHAAQTMRDFWEAGFQVYVHSTGAMYAPGDELDEFLLQVSHEANVAYVRSHRKRKKKKGKKPNGEAN